MTPIITRRRLVATGATLLAALALPAISTAQGKYPSRPVRIVLGLPAGGAGDVAMRQLTAVMQPALGQAIVIENKPGGNFALAMQAVAQAPADGYTLTYVISSMVSGQLVQKRYDMFKSLQPIAMVGASDIALIVGGKSPHNSMQDLIAWAKANPGKLTYASPGIGSLEHLALVNLCARHGIQAVHVPVKGGPEMMQAVAAGDADLSTLAVPLVVQFAPKGMVRPLVVLNHRRNAALPDVPDLKESGIDIPRLVIWGGLAAPTGTPKPVVELLEKAVLAAMENSELRRQYQMAGLVPDPANAAAFAKVWQDDLVWVSKAVAEAKLDAN